MKTFLFIACGVTFSLFSAEDADSFLSSAVADTIIAEREAAKAERKAARRTELEKAEVISEGEGTLPDGRKVIVREVVPPALKKAKKPVTKRPTEPQFAPEQLALINKSKQFQNHKVQMLSCTVYDRRVTELRWRHEGENFVAYTNSDFNYLRGIMTVTTEAVRYDYFFGIGNVDSEQMAKPLPALPKFSPHRSEYVLIEGDSTNAAATAGLEALLAYYDANFDALKVAYQRSQALVAAQRRYEEANPEPKKDFILQFWVLEKKGSGE